MFVFWGGGVFWFGGGVENLLKAPKKDQKKKPKLLAPKICLKREGLIKEGGWLEKKEKS